MANSISTAETVSRLQSFDARLARAAVERVSGEGAVSLLQAVSRFGDWGLSSVTGVVLAVLGGGEALLCYALSTVLGLVLQKSLKRAFDRTRPCLTAGGPVQRAPIPDAGSFPSGHTLHAVLAAGAVATVFAPLAIVYVPMALAMGASRVALGVHYPSDVAAGASLGAALAAAFLVL